MHIVVGHCGVGCFGRASEDGGELARLTTSGDHSSASTSYVSSPCIHGYCGRVGAGPMGRDGGHPVHHHGRGWAHHHLRPIMLNVSSCILGY